ncbi:MAG: DUF4091 domain-containing protein [Candidatus Hydrogenedentes bacterium]|nr:DUF4091 domain-containing protein [Candidatus Hydrogenedentota bacterium]
MQSSYTGRLRARSLGVLLAVAGAAVCAHAGASGPVRARSLITATRCAVAPEIDGDLADAAWRGAGSAPILGSPSQPRNRIHACWDDAALYLAVWCEEPRMATIEAPPVERDGGVFLHESIEFFLSPQDGTGQYFHLMVDAANTQRDEEAPWPKSYDEAWNGVWESAVQRNESSWQLEVAVPFETLGVAPPEPTERWGLNVCRNRVNSGLDGNQLYSWSPLTGSSFHCPSRFGLLRFGVGEGVQIDAVGDLFPGTQTLACHCPAPTNARVYAGAADDFELRGRRAHQGDTQVRWRQFIDDRLVAVEVACADTGALLYASGHVRLDPVLPEGYANRLAQVDPSKRLLKEFHRAAARLAKSTAPLPERLDEWNAIAGRLDAAALEHQARRLLDNGPRAASGAPAYGLAVASSMVKILPQRPELARLTFSPEIRLQAAGNEAEAAQVVLYSPERDLRNVRLAATELRDAHGHVLPASCVSAAPVGFVETHSPKYYAAPIVGWWPDPILSETEQFDVRQGDLQPVWFSVRTPPDAAPGVYTGALTIRPESEPEAIIPVTVEVWEFALPVRSSLRTAVHCAPAYCYPPEQFAPERVTAIEQAFERFLAAHRVNPGSIYRPNKLLEGATLERWAKLDVNAFCIKYIRSGDLNAPDGLHMLPERLEHERTFIAQSLELARQHDMEDRAYVYMFDELRGKHFEGINEVAAVIEREFPNLITLTTAIDSTYGTRSPLKSVKAFCPNTPHYNLELAEQVRREGRQVWWYTCSGPSKPFANLLMEYPAMDIRLLMGFMAYAYHTDGFLYWSMILPSLRSCEQTPYTGWNIDFMGYNGDGNVIYPGQNGPLSSIRMENWLDGAEDYEYLKLAEQRIQQLRDAGKGRAAARLEAELSRFARPGNELVTSLTDYTLDPGAVCTARARLARLIELAGQDL